jgi:hypothetical protein
MIGGKGLPVSDLAGSLAGEGYTEDSQWRCPGRCSARLSETFRTGRPASSFVLLAREEDARMDEHNVRFEITGELALAGFFLMSHWSNPDTYPQLETSDGPLKLVVDTRGNALTELRKTLRMVGASDPSLVASANAWLREVEKRCPANGDGRTGPP